MADPPDFQQLARRYLDLWQDQLAAAASDPGLSKDMSRLAALFGQFPFNWPGDKTAPADSAEQNRSTDDEGAQDRAAAAGAPSSGGAGNLAELARRVAELEARVAVLERTAKPARKPRGKRED